MESKYLAVFAILAVVIAISATSQGSPLAKAKFASVPSTVHEGDHHDHPELSHEEVEQQHEPADKDNHRQARYFYGGYPIGGGMAGASASASASASAGGMGFGGYPLLYG